MSMINGFESHEVIKAVQNWASLEENSNFDTSFIDSLEESLAEFDSLTDRQESGLKNIIDKFNIDISENV